MVSALVEQTVSMSARVDQTTNMLVDILSKLDKDKEELQEDMEEVEENIEDIEEAHFDIQKVGRMVESTKNLVYISIAAFALWNTLWTTWKHCTLAKQDDSQFVHPTENKTRFRDPFNMN